MKPIITAALTAVSLVATSAAIAHTAPDQQSAGRSVHRHSATAAQCANGAQGAMGQGMIDMSSMHKDMSAMMTDMGAMMNSTNDPSMKARMQKMHDQMAGMMANMQNMGGKMMQGRQNSGSTSSVAPSAAPEDHAAHHPN